MDRTPVQNVARLVGIVFLLVGILGFIPGITTNLYDGLEFAGNDGNAELLGIFSVSVLHNIVHGLFGIAGLALAKTAERRPNVPGRRRRDLHRALAARAHRRRGLDPLQLRRRLAAPGPRRRDDRCRSGADARAEGHDDRVAT